MLLLAHEHNVQCTVYADTTISGDIIIFMALLGKFFIIKPWRSFVSSIVYYFTPEKRTTLHIISASNTTAVKLYLLTIISH